MNKDVFESKYAEDIFKQRYSMDGQESWSDTCKRVVTNVCGQHLNADDCEKIYVLMLNREFIPAGRYLYGAGRQFHMVKNCYAFRADDTREGWADLLSKIAITSMTGGGCGVDYSNLRASGTPIKRVGGTSSGPMALIHSVNESARYIRQGGSRRAALLASLNWTHSDINEFIHSKDWPEHLLIAKDIDYNTPLPLELTNISINYDTDFFVAIKNKNHPLHKIAKAVWDANCFQAFKTGEPGFCFNFLKDSESLRNPCVSGDTEIITKNGYERIDELVDTPTEIWNGYEWSIVTPKITGKNQPMMKVTLSDGRELKCTDYHKWLISKDYHGTEERVESRNLKIGDKLVKWKFPQLKKLGLDCARLKFDKSPQRDASQFVKIVKIERIENADVVYCFNEPKNHTGVFNGIMTGQCGEFCSETDGDSCNLGTLYINRIKNKENFQYCVEYATKFLVCGNLYSDYPTSEMRDIALANNRIGLGLGGVHEWMIRNGGKYAVTPELHKWLCVYETMSDESAYLTAKELGLPIPKSKRAIAPTGTISALAESTTGIEPLFCKAYKRKYDEQGTWKYQYVVDGTIQSLIKDGFDISTIQDAYDISFKDRVKVQADLQQYVDQAISSTCNLPKWGTEDNNDTNVKEKASTLLRYAKRLRGFTCYPDGARGGQPLERVNIDEAIDNVGKVFEYKQDNCRGGVCGI